MKNPFGAFWSCPTLLLKDGMKWNEVLKDYFTFTRKERIGVIIVLVAGACHLPVAVIFQWKKCHGPQFK